MSMGDFSTFCSLLQWFIVFIVEVFHFHCYVYSQVFYFFEAIINGIIFLYSFSICSLLVCRKATDFYKLTLYPATLLKLLWWLGVFWWSISGFLGIRWCHLQIGTVWLFPFLFIFLFSSYFIALARNSMTVLNKSGESGHTCLVPDFRGNGFSFSH
jgi:hypothetical protein